MPSSSSVVTPSARARSTSSGAGNRLGHYLFDVSGNPGEDREVLTYDAEGRLYASATEHQYHDNNWEHAWQHYDGLGRRVFT